MTKRTWMAFGAGVTTLVIAIGVGVGVSAQNLAHGIPSPEKVYGDGVTWPIKIETREYDKQKLLAPPDMSEAALDGRILWVQKCAYCHDGVGAPTYRTMGPWIGAETISKLGEDNIRSFINNGDVRMPAFRYEFDSQKMDEVIAFLKTVQSDQKPTPAQLAGRSGTTAASD